MSQPTRQLLALADFNDARLAEDEAACRAARKDGGGCWNLIANERGDGAIYDDMGNPVLEYDTDPETGIPARPNLNPLGARQAAHIVRHDPDRVLAEISAKRLLVSNWRELIQRIDAETNSDRRERLSLTRHGLDQVAFQFAAVHSDHPDFQPGWRP